ncbi:MAG: hypothetical protein ABJB86_02835 [Bacteroidota bacterium]
MVVTAFKFKFKHNGETIPADCQVFDIYAHMQYRVVLTKENNKEKVLVFYKISRSENKFFWFPLPDPHNELAQSVANALAAGTK